MKIDWRSKLTSRKFWAAVAGWVGAMYVVVTTPITQEKIIALVAATGVLCSYIFAEGMTDSAHAPYTQSYSEGESDADSD